MKSSKYLVAAGSLLALLASPALAYEEGTWVLRAGVGVVAPDSDNLVLGPDAVVEVDDGTSLTLMGTYMFSRHWAFDILASWPFSHDIKLQGEKVAETEHLPPTFSLQYHFLPDSTIQPYVGAGVNYTTFLSTDLEQVLIEQGVEDIELNDSFGLALQLGADWTFGNRWLLNVDMRWIDIESDLDLTVGGVTDEAGTVKIDPWVYSINVGYTF